MPLPLYGSGGRTLRVRAAIWWTICLLQPLIWICVADGVVTDGEYFDAVSRVRDCMVREGFEVGELDSRADGNVMFSYIRPDAVSVSAEDSAIYQACVQAHQLPLVPLRFNG